MLPVLVILCLFFILNTHLKNIIFIHLTHREIKPEETYFDRDVEKAFMKASTQLFEDKTQASLLVSNQNGNMYTPSVYGCLASVLAQ